MENDFGRVTKSLFEREKKRLVLFYLFINLLIIIVLIKDSLTAAKKRNPVYKNQEPQFVDRETMV